MWAIICTFVVFLLLFPCSTNLGHLASLSLILATLLLFCFSTSSTIYHFASFFSTNLLFHLFPHIDIIQSLLLLIIILAPLQ